MQVFCLHFHLPWGSYRSAPCNPQHCGTLGKPSTKIWKGNQSGKGQFNLKSLWNWSLEEGPARPRCDPVAWLVGSDQWLARRRSLRLWRAGAPPECEPPKARCSTDRCPWHSRTWKGERCALYSQKWGEIAKSEWTVRGLLLWEKLPNETDPRFSLRFVHFSEQGELNQYHISNAFDHLYNPWFIWKGFQKPH